MSNLAARFDRIEKTPQAKSAVRISRALAGELDVSKLTDAELQSIVDQTPAELQAMFAKLTDEQLDAICTMQLEELPPDLRAVCDEIIAAGARVQSAAQNKATKSNGF